MDFTHHALYLCIVVQPLTGDGKEDGEPLLAIDNLGARSADLVILCGEGGAVRKLMGHNNAPVRWFVRDLGSTNGIFVKHSTDLSFGQRITQPREIANGDELAFGNARFVFRTK